MSYICGVDRAQRMLLPETVEQYVHVDSPVRVVEEFVDTLELKELGFTKTVAAATGRPPYAPEDLLKLLVWGYLNRVRSTRRLEAECARNLELIWLMRQLRPDFKTIADFRRDNAVALKGVFREFVLWSRDLELVGGELVAIDGTKLQASNHPSRRASAEQLAELIQGVDARIAEYLEALEQSESDLLGEESPPAQVPGLARKLAELKRRKKTYTEALAVAQASGQKAPLTDPQCQSMKGVGLGYNAQIAVDDKHHLIVAAEIADRSTDHEQLPVVAAVVQEVLESQELTVVADGGYYDREALAAATRAGVTVCVPQPRKGYAASEGCFAKSDFVYEAHRDGYRCLAGRLLARTGSYHKHGVKVAAYSEHRACEICPLKAQCTGGDYRRIERWEDEAIIEEIAQRVADQPQLLRKRKALVEHPFGTIKFWRGQKALLTRGRRMAQAEFSLSALAYNLTRVIAIRGVAKLLESLRKPRRTRLQKQGSRFFRRQHPHLARSRLQKRAAVPARDFRADQRNLAVYHFSLS